MKLFPKLLFTFLAIALVPLCVISLFMYARFREFAIAQQKNDLEEIAKSRILYITDYIENLQKEAAIVAQTTNTAEAVTAFSNAIGQGPQSPAYKAAGETFIPFIDLFSHKQNVNDVYLLDLDGKVVFSMRQLADLGANVEGEKLRNTQLEAVYKKCRATLEATISEFKIYPLTGDPEVLVAAPIFKDRELQGVFAFQLPPEEVYAIFHDYTSLKETGEVLIAERDGDEILFVNPIRHRPGAAFTFRIPIGANKALPMQEAVQQIAGKGISIDYRDKKVIAVWNYLPSLEWGIVVKIDLDEVLEPISHLRNLIILVAGITGLAVLLIVLGIARFFTKPINDLREAARQIAAGNLDIQIPARTSDELGELSETFTQMATALKSSTTSIGRLEEEVSARKRLEEARSEMLSRISHELRTPLTPIQEGVGIILDDKEGKLSDNQKEMFTLVEKNTKRLGSLIHDILDLNQLSESHMHFSPGEMNTIVGKALDAHRDEAKTKGLDLQSELDNALPSLDADWEKVTRVVDNLLSNAIKFTNEGQIVVKTETDSKSVIVSVRDTGIGISVDDQKKLFESFRELDLRTKEKVQGFGIGLAASHATIEAHRGKMWVESTPGQGSTFFFSIPLEKHGKKDSDH